MSLHDELFRKIAAVSKSVHLVASLRDARIGFPGDDDLRIFIPDMHVVSQATRAKYQYGTNDMSLLAAVVRGIDELKASSPGKTVALYQIGDFLDLWREEPVSKARSSAATRIIEDHPELMDAFFSPSLKARFLLGNHDVDLAWWPQFVAWERRYFLPPRGSDLARGIVLHGDVFDWVESLPDAFNRFFVYYFSPLRGAADHDLKDVKAVTDAQNAGQDYRQRIAGTAELAELSALPPAAVPVPARHNLQRHKYLKSARETCAKANDRFGLGLRFAVIGHTHQARIALHDGGGDDFFALVDCGAWIENGVDAQRRPFQNQQLAALSQNEFRIYQIER